MKVMAAGQDHARVTGLNPLIWHHILDRRETCKCSNLAKLDNWQQPSKNTFGSTACKEAAVLCQCLREADTPTMFP